MPTPHSIAAMRAVARRRLPKFVFDYCDGGAGQETALEDAVAAFSRRKMRPRILTGCESRDQSIQLLGQTFASPFGVAPVGLANLVHSGTDLALAQAARFAAVPYILSTAATTSLEQIARAAPGSWFQLYVGADQAIVDDLIDRAETCDFATLVVTADVPAPGKRLRDLMNGFVLPFRPSPRLVYEVIRHPAWLLDYLLHGGPQFENLKPYQHQGGATQDLATLMASQSSARLDWLLLNQIRRRWKGSLVLKGVLDPADAERAVSLGVDGLIVSSHGGRQLNCAPAPLDALGPIVEACPPGIPVMMDGGARCGEDVAMALALGARMVFLGRPFLFAVGALGPRSGPTRLIALLQDELDRALAHLGCASLGDLATLSVLQSPVA